MEIKEKNNILAKKYYENNKIKIKEKAKIKRDNLTDEEKLKIKLYNKEHRNKNIDKYKLRDKEYREKNLEKCKLNSVKYIINRRKTDIIFNLKSKIRCNISQSFKRNGNKKCHRTEFILGCSIVEFKKYLESKFLHWMNWNNHGLYNGELNFGWDIDHIEPISSATTEDEIIRLNHYTNIQPLCSYTNRYIKKDKY